MLMQLGEAVVLGGLATAIDTVCYTILHFSVENPQGAASLLEVLPHFDLHGDGTERGGSVLESSRSPDVLLSVSREE